jgi:hypothetical protein
MAKNTEETTAAPEAEATPKKPKIELRESNGITEPREGSKTRRVWDIANEIGTETGAPPTLADVKARAQAEGLNDATIQTQYNRFRKFYGLPPQGRAKKAEEPAAAPETETAE